MVAYWIDYAMTFTSSGAQWRFPISVQILFALVSIVLVAFLPESPRWLLYHDQRDEAENILLRLHAHRPEGTTEREMAEILVAIREEKLAAQGKGYSIISFAAEYSSNLDDQRIARDVQERRTEISASNVALRVDDDNAANDWHQRCYVSQSTYMSSHDHQLG